MLNLKDTMRRLRLPEKQGLYRIGLGDWEVVEHIFYLIGLYSIAYVPRDTGRETLIKIYTALLFS